MLVLRFAGMCEDVLRGEIMAWLRLSLVPSTLGAGELFCSDMGGEGHLGALVLGSGSGSGGMGRGGQSPQQRSR